MSKGRIVVLIALSPFWIPLFVFIGVLGIAVLIPGHIVGLFVGLLEYGFKGDADLLKELVTQY